jgi:hypothetical protein
MYSIRRIIINPQTIRSIYTNTSNSIKQSGVQNKIGIRNASTIELLESIKKDSYSNKFWALQELSIKYALPFGFTCALGSTIRCEYDNIKFNKFCKSELGIKNKTQELNVDHFLHSLGAHCIIVGIPTAFKTVFFHVYGICFIIVSAINYVS